jgi:hypothetical protein
MDRLPAFRRGDCLPWHRTRGHLRPRRGDGQPRLWLWQCAQCNSDQGYLTLGRWHARLAGRRDPRAPIVAALIERLAALGVRPEAYR